VEGKPPATPQSTRRPNSAAELPPGPARTAGPSTGSGERLGRLYDEIALPRALTASNTGSAARVDDFHPVELQGRQAARSRWTRKGLAAGTRELRAYRRCAPHEDTPGMPVAPASARHRSVRLPAGSPGPRRPPAMPGAGTNSTRRPVWPPGPPAPPAARRGPPCRVHKNIHFREVVLALRANQQVLLETLDFRVGSAPAILFQRCLRGMAIQVHVKRHPQSGHYAPVVDGVFRPRLLSQSDGKTRFGVSPPSSPNRALARDFNRRNWVSVRPISPQICSWLSPRR